MLQIAENLRMIREDALEVSRTQFVEYLNIDGLTFNILQNIETGRTIPKTHLVRQLAQKIGISENDLKNKKLSKKDVPVIVIEKTTPPQASTVTPAIVDVLQKQIEQQQNQIDQQQKVIEMLMQQLKDA